MGKRGTHRRRGNRHLRPGDRTVRIPGFEWDRAKEAANRRKHGVGFDEARTVFERHAVEVLADEAHSVFEPRWFARGESGRGRLLAVWYTVRGEVIRIIGARKLNATVRADHEANKK